MQKNMCFSEYDPDKGYSQKANDSLACSLANKPKTHAELKEDSTEESLGSGLSFRSRMPGTFPRTGLSC